MELFARGMHGTGFYPAISAKYDQRRPLHNGQSFFTTYDEAQNHNVMQTYTLSHIGLPLTMDKQNCYGAVFAGDLPDGFTDEELLEFLKKSVLMDADAAMAFTRRGLGRYIGVSVGEEVTDGIEEYFADHPVNKGVVGYRRDVRPAFYGKGGRLLHALDDGSYTDEFYTTPCNDALISAWDAAVPLPVAVTPEALRSCASQDNWGAPCAEIWVPLPQNCWAIIKTNAHYTGSEGIIDDSFSFNYYQTVPAALAAVLPQ